MPRIEVPLLICAWMSGCSYPLSESNRMTYVEPARTMARATLDDPEFAKVLEAIPASAFDHASDPDELRGDDGSRVLERLRAADLDFNVACRRSANRVTWAWEGDDVLPRTVALRCAWFSRQEVADWSGTLVHELAHHAGYLHDGNERPGNQCTVPHLAADALIYFSSLRANQKAKLPSDVCPSLAEAVVANTP